MPIFENFTKDLVFYKDKRQLLTPFSCFLGSGILREGKPLSSRKKRMLLKVNPPSPLFSLLVEASNSQAELPALELTPTLCCLAASLEHTQCKQRAFNALAKFGEHNIFLSFSSVELLPPFVPILSGPMLSAQLSLNLHRGGSFKKPQVLPYQEHLHFIRKSLTLKTFQVKERISNGGILDIRTAMGEFFCDKGRLTGTLSSQSTPHTGMWPGNFGETEADSQ